MEKRFYYKDGKGNYFNFKSEHKDLIPITEKEFDEHAKVEVPQIDEKLFETQQKIAELKYQLASTDYKAIKFAEGLMSEEDYEPTRQARQELRKQIKELEKSL